MHAIRVASLPVRLLLLLQHSEALVAVADAAGCTVKTGLRSSRTYAPSNRYFRCIKMQCCSRRRVACACNFGTTACFAWPCVLYVVLCACIHVLGLLVFRGYCLIHARGPACSSKTIAITVSTAHIHFASYRIVSYRRKRTHFYAISCAYTRAFLLHAPASAPDPVSYALKSARFYITYACACALLRSVLGGYSITLLAPVVGELSGFAEPCATR